MKYAAVALSLASLVSACSAAPIEDAGAAEAGGADAGSADVGTDDVGAMDAARSDGAVDANGPDTGGPDSLESLASALVGATCAPGGYFARCLSRLLTGFDDADCSIAFEPAMATELHRWRASLDAGRATYDADAASRCLTALTTGACDEFGEFAPLPPACDDVLVGTVPSGGDCDATDECLDDLVCRGDSPCGQTCQAPLAAGATCGRDDCGPGADCVGSCVAGAGRGETCSPTMPCRNALLCVAGTCRGLDEAGLAAVGAACTEVFAFGSFQRLCAVGYCNGRTGVCEDWVAPGGACTFEAFCSATSRCFDSVCVPNAALGAPCDVAAGPACVGGTSTYCTSAGVCAARVAVGGACTEPGACSGGGVCTMGTCVDTSSCP